MDLVRLGLAQQLVEFANAAYGHAPIWLHGRLLNYALSGDRGFISSDQDSVVVAFSGTANLEDVLTDFEAWQSPYPLGKNNGYVHAGFCREFLGVYKEVRAVLQWECMQNKKVYVVGHSLGGAVAVQLGLAIALDLNKVPTVVTYGCPRVGDKQFARLFKTMVPESIRVVLDNDIVPEVPRWDYRHVHGKIHIDNDGRTVGAIRAAWSWLKHFKNDIKSILSGDFQHDHSLQVYIKALKHAVRLNGVGAWK